MELLLRQEKSKPLFQLFFFTETGAASPSPGGCSGHRDGFLHLWDFGLLLVAAALAELTECPRVTKVPRRLVVGETHKRTGLMGQSTYLDSPGCRS